MSSLFGSKPKVTQSRNPYEDESASQTIRDLTEDQTRDQTQTGSRTDLSTQTQTGTDVVGLQDIALLDKLRNELGEFNFDNDASIINSLLKDEQTYGTTDAYNRFKSPVVQDYHANKTGQEHLAALAGAPTSARERATRINDESLARGLALAHDEARASSQGRILNLLAQRQGNAFAPLQQYSSLLANTPFRRQTVRDATTEGQVDTTTQQQLNDAINRILSDRSETESQREGFSTQSSVSKDPSIFSQIAGAAVGAGALGFAPFTGGASLAALPLTGKPTYGSQGRRVG